MASIYKLNYFNSYGISEPIRWMFKYKKIDFVDKRYEYDSEEWKNDKKDIPWGTLPYFEFESGKGLHQSFSIARYLAGQFDLAGENDFEAAKIDEYADTARDLFNSWVIYYFPESPEKKEEAFKKLNIEIFPPALKNIEKELKKNGGEYLVGKKISWADFVIAHYFQQFFMENFNEKLLDEYPVFKAYVKGIYEIPEIKKWVTERPISVI